MTEEHPAPSVDEAFVAARNPEVCWVTLDGKVLVYDPQRESIHLLSPSAATIWRLLDGVDPLGEISADLAEAYSLDPEAMLADVFSTVRALAHQGLIDATRPDPGC